MPREASKSRQWEKERRNRVNEAFLILSKLLPCYDPAVNIPKIEILRNATSHIEDLQTKIKKLLSSNNENSVAKVKSDEFKKLHGQIKRLLGKNEQLCCLLREAKIPIPRGCGFVRKFNNPLKWRGRIQPEQAKILQKKESERENRNVQSRIFSNKTKVGLQSGTPKHRKTIVNRLDVKKLKPGKKKKFKLATPSKCLIVLSQPSITQPYYVITNATSNLFGNTSTAIRPPNIVTNSIVSSKSVKASPPIAHLGPGTLILANGTIVPVLPQQTVLPVIRPPVIIIPKVGATTPNGSAPNSIAVTSAAPTKSMPRIRPKYCLTTTTQVNKVPIPALTSRYANTDLVRKKIEAKLEKPSKVSEKKTDSLLRKPENCEKRKVSEPCVEFPDAKKNKIEENAEQDPVKNVETAQEPQPPAPLSASPAVSQEKMSSEDKTTVPPPVVSQPEKDTKKGDEDVELNINHSELSNDIFASLQVPAGCQNPESTSPTAAFLLAFPLVSSLTGVKVTEVIEDDNTESQRGTPTLLQIGTMETTKPTQSENLTPNLLNLDNLSFFSSKEISGFYSSFEGVVTTASVASHADSKSFNTYENTVTTALVTSHVNSKCYNSFESIMTTSVVTSGTVPKSYETLDNAIITTASVVTNPDSKVYNTFGGVAVTTSSGTTNRKNSVQGDEKKKHYQTQSQNRHHPSLGQQQQQAKSTDLETCYDQRNSLPNFNNALNYRSKSTAKNHDPTYLVQKSFCNNFTESSKIVTVSSHQNSIKTYPEPLYTNSNTSYSYSHASDTNFNQTYYKNFSKTDNRSYYPLNYDNYSNFSAPTATTTTPTNYYANSHKFSNSQVKNKNISVVGGNTTARAPINWMTTPDNKLQTPTDYGLPQFSKESEFSSIYSTNTFTNSQPSYFTTNPVYHSNVNEVGNASKSNLELPFAPPVNGYQRNEVEENQFSWSPTKLPQFLDPPHNFVSSTLPTLVGDLALGNPLAFGEIKIDNKCQKKDSCRRLKGYDTGNNQNQSNFLSVSQLVDHGKEPVPGRTTTRRNSGNRSSAKTKIPTKTTPRKDPPPNNKMENFGKINQIKQLSYTSSHPVGGGDIFCDPTTNKNRTKNSYSAEALIGHQLQSSDLNQKSRQQNFTGSSNKTLSVPPFLHDNIIPYFPSVDFPTQDNSYIQQNQNYHNFSNNSYTTNSFIPTTTSYNFIHEMAAPSHDIGDNLNLFSSTKNCVNKTSVKSGDIQCPPAGVKKTKRKHSNDLPGFVDFPFLSMPGSINSPILPDDFHTHTSFLQPPTPQLYSCKNPFTKSNDLGSGGLLPLPPVGTTRTSIQHPEISPSINTAGTSFANFNLCTIIPEINGKSTSEPYLEPIRGKEQTRSYSSTVQVSFNDKPTLSFSYINCTTAQTFNNH